MSTGEFSAPAAKAAQSDIKRRRAELGMTQAQLAAELGCTKRTIRNWESGRIAVPHAVSRLLRRDWIVMAAVEAGER